MNILFRVTSILVVTSVLLTGCSSDKNTEKAISNIERSTAYERQGQYRAALIEVRNAIQADPENPEHLKYYAKLLIKIGSPNQAEALLKQHENLLDGFRLTLVDALLKQGKFISAGQYLKDWQPNEQDNAEYQRLSALQMYMSGNREKALDNYRSLVGSTNASLESNIELVSLLIENSELSEAEKWISRLEQDHLEDPKILYLSALLAEKRDNLEKAESQLTTALSHLQPTDIMLNERTQVLELLSSVLTRQGRPDEALIYSKIIREANPEAFVAQQQYKDALNSAQKGDLASARAAFEDILDQFPNNQQAALLLGLIHLEEGDVTGGEELLSANLDAETAPSTIIRATALAQTELDKPEQALEVLEKALLAKPDDVTLLSLYGVISLNNNKEQQGVKSISKALQLAPERTRLHLLMAQYYAEKENTALALGHLRKAYQQNAADWPTTSFYINLLIKTDERAEAQKVKEDIEANYRDNSAALWVLSMMEYQLGNSQASTDLLVELHQKEPDSINVINALGRLYQQTGSYEQASSMWLKALEINPGNLNFLSSLISTKSKVTSSAQLIDFLNEEAKADPQLAMPLDAAAVELLVNQGELDRARNLYKKHNGDKNAYTNLMAATILRGEAITLANQEKWQPALEKAREATQLVTNNDGLTLLLSRLEARNGNVDTALNLLGESLKASPNNVRLINEKARILTQSKSASDALDYLTPIWKKQANGALAQVYFGLINQVKPNQLEAALLELLVAEPGNAGALNTLAGIKQSQGKEAEAARYYQQAIQNNPSLVPALNNLAWLLKEKQPEQALSYSKKAAELAPKSAAVLDTYGWILHLNGHKSQSISILEQALSLDPNNSEIQDHKRIAEES
jgi:cellulose synthase operon protein C